MLRAISNCMFGIAFVLIAGAMGLLVAGLGVTGEALAVNSVSIGDNFFAPQSIAISAGSAVEWRNDGTRPHTSTSDSGIWDSDLLRNGQTFSQAFNSAGTFTYNCAFHPEMAGTVVVEASAPVEPTPAPTQPPAAATQATPGPAQQGSNQPSAAQVSSGPNVAFPNGGGPPLPRSEMFQGALVLVAIGSAFAVGGLALLIVAVRTGPRATGCG